MEAAGGNKKAYQAKAIEGIRGVPKALHSRNEPAKIGKQPFRMDQIIREVGMDLSTVRLDFPEDGNIILGQTHFIKSVEDLYEIMVTQVPSSRFGLAFCEASGVCLIRSDGNDPELIDCAVANMQKVAAGHAFLIVLKEAFPINVLNAVKACPEVCQVFCATANPVEVLIAETDQGRGIMGVIDGFPPKGVEQEKDKTYRKEFLRKIGYKRG
jgi:adenosine/AMP kinase